MTDMEQCFGQLIHLANVNREQSVCPQTPQTLAAPTGPGIPAGLSPRTPDIFRHKQHYSAR